MRIPALGGLVALLVAAPAVAASGVVDDRAATPLEQGAFIAMPAVYDLQSDQRVDFLIVDKRRVPVGRHIPIRGTAFGVAPGRVVTARHVVAPSRQLLLEEIIAAAGLSGMTTDPSGVRIVGTRRTVSLVPAHGTGVASRALVRRLSDPVDDLALLKIDDLEAPTLALDDTLTRGTPVAVIGFGAQPRAIPAVRTGTLDGPRRIEDTDNVGFGGFDGEVLRGDSGAPVVDADGEAHGVVLRLRTDTAPVIARADAVRALLKANGATGGESATTTDFRAAMEAFWRRDYRSAAASLARLRDADPGGALISREHQRATTLVTVDYRVHNPRGARDAILAIGGMATLAAAALGALRIRRQTLSP